MFSGIATSKVSFFGLFCQMWHRIENIKKLLKHQAYFPWHKIKGKKNTYDNIIY